MTTQPNAHAPRQDSTDPPKSGGLTRNKRRSRPDSTKDKGVQKRAAEMPKLHKAAYLRAAAGQASAAGAIRCHCQMCCGWDLKAVRDCTGIACPLYAYRPYQAKGGVI